MGQDDRTLNYILKFPNIAGPIVLLERGKCIAGNPLDLLSHSRCVCANEVVNEQPNGLRDRLLACPGFPLDQNGTVGGCNHADLIEHARHSPACSDDLLEWPRFRGLFTAKGLELTSEKRSRFGLGIAAVPPSGNSMSNEPPFVPDSTLREPQGHVSLPPRITQLALSSQIFLGSGSEESGEVTRECRTAALLFHTQHGLRAANRVSSITSQRPGGCVTGSMPEQNGVAQSDDGRLKIKLSAAGSRGNQLNQKQEIHP